MLSNLQSSQGWGSENCSPQSVILVNRRTATGGLGENYEHSTVKWFRATDRYTALTVK